MKNPMLECSNNISKIVIVLVTMFLFMKMQITCVSAANTSFVFTGNLPANVGVGQTFTFPATITNVGPAVVNYNSFFQIYDQNYNFLSQTFYMDQTFNTGQTLDYNVTMTAPSTTGLYYVLDFVFETNYTFAAGYSTFAPFNVVPISEVPEPNSGTDLSILLLGMAGVVCYVKSRSKMLRLDSNTDFTTTSTTSVAIPTPNSS